MLKHSLKCHLFNGTLRPNVFFRNLVSWKVVCLANAHHTVLYLVTYIVTDTHFVTYHSFCAMCASFYINLYLICHYHDTTSESERCLYCTKSSLCFSSNCVLYQVGFTTNYLIQPRNVSIVIGIILTGTRQTSLLFSQTYHCTVPTETLLF